MDKRAIDFDQRKTSIESKSKETQAWAYLSIKYPLITNYILKLYKLKSNTLTPKINEKQSNIIFNTTISHVPFSQELPSHQP